MTRALAALLPVGMPLAQALNAASGVASGDVKSALEEVRAVAPDARIVACGHTHLPEVRDLGWKLIVNDGSAGYVFDGDPTASWARIDVEDGQVQAEIRRTEYDALAVANAP